MLNDERLNSLTHWPIEIEQLIDIDLRTLISSLNNTGKRDQHTIEQDKHTLTHIAPNKTLIIRESMFCFQMNRLNEPYTIRDVRIAPCSNTLSKS